MAYKAEVEVYVDKYTPYWGHPHYPTVFAYGPPPPLHPKEVAGREWEPSDDRKFKEDAILQSVTYRRSGQPHRDGGPAFVYPGGEAWYANGVLHREGGPAVTRAKGAPDVFDTNWGKWVDWPRRLLLPAKEWYAAGQLHNDNGPAVIYQDGTKVWYCRGVCHRADGPAIEYSDGTERWAHKGTLTTWSRGPPALTGSSLDYKDTAARARLAVVCRATGHVDAIEVKKGCPVRQAKGVLHCADGPALTLANGTRCWYWQNVLHRDGGPAIDCEVAPGVPAAGKGLMCVWMQRGAIHRVGGPALYYFEGDTLVQEWYYMGMKHNFYEPQCVWNDGARGAWWLFGRPRRGDRSALDDLRGDRPTPAARRTGWPAARRTEWLDGYRTEWRDRHDRLCRPGGLPAVEAARGDMPRECRPGGLPAVEAARGDMPRECRPEGLPAVEAARGDMPRECRPGGLPAVEAARGDMPRAWRRPDARAASGVRFASNPTRSRNRDAHRAGGPADVGFGYRKWFARGLAHRALGPARVGADGAAWYKRGLNYAGAYDNTLDDFGVPDTSDAPDAPDASSVPDRLLAGCLYPDNESDGSDWSDDQSDYGREDAPVCECSVCVYTGVYSDCEQPPINGCEW
jgi:hypothetical protein